MGSTRLPGKVLKSFCGLPLLQFQLELLTKYNLGFEIVVATTTEKGDQSIIDLCRKNDVKTFTGSESNVFYRFKKVAESYGFDHIIRLTADNPLVSYSLINECIKLHLSGDYALTSTREIGELRRIKRYVPKGLSLDIINCKALLSIDQNNLDKFEKEHVIPIFYNGHFNVGILDSNTNYEDDLSVDTQHELNRVQEFANSLIEKDKLYKYLGFEE